MTDIFTDDDMAQAEGYSTVGPQYFAARRVVGSAMAAFTEEHATEIAKGVYKILMDEVYTKFQEVLEDSILSDAELNLQNTIRNMVERTIIALLSGEEWALNMYPLAKTYDREKIIKAIAAHVPDEVMQSRIAALEKECADLRRTLDFYRRT